MAAPQPASIAEGEPEPAAEPGAGSRLSRAVPRVILAAAAVGALEALQSMVLGAPAGPAWIAGGCGAVLALLLVGSVVLAVAAPRLLMQVWGALRGRARPARSSSGTPAARTFWRGALVLAALAALWMVTYQATARVHAALRFRDSAVVALILACVVMGTAMMLGLVVVAIDRLLGARAERRLLRLAEALRARPRLRRALAVLGALAAALAPVALVRWTVPAFTLSAVVVGSALVVLACWAARSTMGGQAWARGAALGLCLAIGLAPWASTRSAGARRTAIEQGVLGKVALRWLWARADRDGDGHASAAVGGADCDDADPRRHPLAAELPGNGEDDNCNGTQAEASPHRVAAPSSSAPPSTPSPVPLVASSASPSVLLISIDTLRADHLGAWGYPRPTSPNLDALAARSTRFAWALTSCPSTRCAMPALMTGRFASTLRPQVEVPTLATVLRDAGWETVAITCCDRFVDAREISGFSTVDTSAQPARLARAGQSNADLVIDATLRWLERPRAATAPPFFLWLHLFDPHYPYLAPEEPGFFGPRELDRYDAEIRYTDRELGRLLAELTRRGLDERMVIAVIADHGDEFGEHGIRFHARSLYNQVVRVPLLVHAPAAPPRVVETPVSLVDVMPTLLELAGAPVPTGLNGWSLAQAVRGQAPAPARPVLIELIPDHQISRNLIGVVWDSWKTIWDREANAWSLYALPRDPHDLRDRAAAEPLLLPRLMRQLGETMDAELGEPAPPR